MHTYHSLAFLTFILAISCTGPKSENYKGTWLIEGDEMRVYAEINDSLINLRVPANDCDSTFQIVESIPYKSGGSDSGITTLMFNYEGNEVESKFTFTSESTALWKWNSPENEDTLNFTSQRADIPFTEDKPILERRLGGYQSFVYEHADSLSQLSNRLAMTTELSTEAADVVMYIDSLRHRLLDPLKEEYSSVKCAFADWKLNQNSRASDTLIGEIPYRPQMKGLSANRLKQKLQVYSGTLEKDVLDVFPDFNQNHLGDQIYYRNNPIHWETFHFYNVPMGLTILKLNEFELNIYRIEKIRGLLV